MPAKVGCRVFADTGTGAVATAGGRCVGWDSWRRARRQGGETTGKAEPWSNSTWLPSTIRLRIGRYCSLARMLHYGTYGYRHRELTGGLLPSASSGLEGFAPRSPLVRRYPELPTPAPRSGGGRASPIALLPASSAMARLRSQQRVSCSLGHLFICCFEMFWNSSRTILTLPHHSQSYPSP